jgi:apolipoprotein N-acyltransferase
MAPPATRPRSQRNNPIGALILLFGVLMLLGQHSIWPGILALIGIGSLIGATNRGRPDKGLTGLVWWCGLALLFATGTFWPGILALVFLSMALGGWRRGYGRWW